jgi:hypothetical protein
MKNSDIFLFRFGYFNQLKLNIESMLMSYDATRWYAFDLIIDWENQRVTIYIDGVGQCA